jgi:LysR family glycine cleavage system transcriptional activator
MLTPLGTSVSNEFSNAFDALGSALHRLRAVAPKAVINIAALPSVAQLWLSPRLPAIRASFPDHVISITALEKPPNLMREMFDMSIFIGPASGAPFQRILEHDIIFPVCAPAVASRLHAPADLTGETLIHDAVWDDDWRRWLDHASCPMLATKDGPVFSLYSIALDEARNGAGVLMGHKALVERYLHTGELVAPFAQEIRTGKSLILETTRPEGGSDLVRRIADMLMA